MIRHPRTDWMLPPELVTGPIIRWPGIDTVAVHYTAAIDLIDGDPGEDWAGIPAYLRRIHHDYLTNRPQADGSTGYSVGYNVAIDARGHAWELRGFDIKCAANKGHNEHTFAVLMLVDGQSEGTDAALAAARDIIAEAEQHAGRELVIAPHSALAATQCCGDGLRRQINLGLFSPRWKPLTPRPPDPSEEDDDVPTWTGFVQQPSKPETRAFLTFNAAGAHMTGCADDAAFNFFAAAFGIPKTSTVIPEFLYADLQDKALRSMGFK